MSSPRLLDVTILTVFAREILEGCIIVAEYRAIVLYGGQLEPGVSTDRALRAIRTAALAAVALAVLLVVAVAVPLALLARDFDEGTVIIIEGVSQIVASICMLQLSLKLPKWMFYNRKLLGKPDAEDAAADAAPGADDAASAPDGGDNAELVGAQCADERIDGCEVGEADASCPTEPMAAASDGLTLASIRFNVAFNIWREVAECGIFLIPAFLAGEGLAAIPLSAFVGILLGGILGYAVYYVNHCLRSAKLGFTLFVVLLVSFLSAGLMAAGCGELESELRATPQVYQIPGPFWDSERMPMTFLEPFGYSSTRSVLQIAAFWGWLGLLALLQYLQYRRYLRAPTAALPAAEATKADARRRWRRWRRDTLETGESSSGSDSRREDLSDSSGSGRELDGLGDGSDNP